MTEPVEERVERRGRKTKEEEGWAFLAEQGITAETIEQLKAGGQPATANEMLNLAVADIWTNFKYLTPTAKIHALKEIRALAKADDGSGDSATVEPLVADIIGGIVHLPDERKRQILERELVRLGEERARIEEVLSA